MDFPADAGPVCPGRGEKEPQRLRPGVGHAWSLVLYWFAFQKDSPFNPVSAINRARNF